MGQYIFCNIKAYIRRFSRRNPKVKGYSSIPNVALILHVFLKVCFFLFGVNLPIRLDFFLCVQFFLAKLFQPELNENLLTSNELHVFGRNDQIETVHYTGAQKHYK